MEKDMRDTINSVVRIHVMRTYGDATCVGTIKVLADVLRKGWGLELTPHIVSLRVIPAQALAILENKQLQDSEKIALTNDLPDDEKQHAIESSGNDSTFHMIGRSGTENKFFLWDPSIDQINHHLRSCKFDPICLPLSERIPNANGPEDIVFRVNGCLLVYREQSHLNEQVFLCDAWNMDYSDITGDVLCEIKDIVASGSANGSVVR